MSPLYQVVKPIRHDELEDVGSDPVLGDGSQFAVGTAAARPVGTAFADGRKRFYYASDEDKMYRHDGAGAAWVEILAREIAASGVVTKRKTSSFGFTNTVALSTDPEFSIPVKAGEIWTLFYALRVTGPAAADVKVALAAPAGSSGFSMIVALATTAVGREADARVAHSLSFTAEHPIGTIGTANADHTGALLMAYVAAGGDGAIDFQAAQLVADLGTSYVRNGSFMLAQRKA